MNKLPQEQRLTIFHDSSSGPNGSCLSGFTQGPYYHTGLNLMPSVGDVVYQGAAPSNN